MISFLVDTSYLITLADPVRPQHETAKKYLREALKQGVPLAEAKSELSLRYGHIRQADTGVLDFFFERYLADNERRPMPFFEWVETVYDSDEVKRAFEAQDWSKRGANRIVNSVLRRE